MANTYLTSNLISREAVAIFKSLTSVIATGYRDYESMFSNKPYASGETINIRQDNFYIGSRGDTVSAESIVEQSFPITVQPLYSIPIKYRPTDLQRSIVDFAKEFIEPAARRIVAMMNTDIVNAAPYQINNYVGDPASYVNSYAALDAVNPVMDTLNMNMYKRYAILNSQNAHQLRSAASLQNSFLPTLNKDITINATIGRLADFDLMKDNAIQLHTAGTHATAGTIQVNAAVSSGSQIQLKGLSVGATYLAGDIFSLGGVKKFDQINRIALPDDMQFTVIPDPNTGDTVYTADGGGLVTLNVFPAIVSSGPRQNFITPGASPNQIPVNTVVTSIGNHTNNLCYTERGLVTCMPVLHRMDSPFSSTFTSNGVSMRVSKSAEILDNMNILRLDAQLAFGWVPNQAVRLISL